MKVLVIVLCSIDWNELEIIEKNKIQNTGELFAPNDTSLCNSTPPKMCV